MNNGRIINYILIIITIISACVLGLIISSYFYEYLNTEEGNQLVIFTADETDNNKIIENKQEISTQQNIIEQIEPVESTITTSNNGNSSNIQLKSKYYYNQLDEYSKIIYNAFENNIENLKTGTYKIQFGSEFNSLLKQENGTDLLNKYFQVAWDAFYYDNPQVFYIDASKFTLMVKTTTKGLKTDYSVYIDNGENANYLQDQYTSKAQINSIINELENLKSQFKNQMSNISSNEEKVKALHDWIVDNVEYDINMENINRYTICGALIDRTAVCEGYAKLFKYILDSINIESILVSGTAVNSVGEAERHMWNYVKLDGIWYGVDCTWDDPIIQGNGKITAEMKYKYFLKGKDTFDVDHQTQQITENNNVLKYPEL